MSANGIPFFDLPFCRTGRNQFIFFIMNLGLHFNPRLVIDKLRPGLRAKGRTRERTATLFGVLHMERTNHEPVRL